MHFIHAIDFVLYPFYLITLMVLVKNVLRYFVKDEKIRKLLFIGFLLKVVGGTLFALIYQYYYKGGDTAGYFWGGKAYVLMLFDHPMQFLQQYFGNEQFEFTDKYLVRANNGEFFLGLYGDTAFYSGRIFFFACLLGLNSYLPATLLMATFSFLGAYLLFQTFMKVNPKYYKQYFIGIFCSPNLLIWGSAMNKDTITLTCLSIVVYTFYNLFIRSKFNLFQLVIMLLAYIYLVYIKIYIAIAILPCLFIYLLLTKISNIKSKFIQIAIFPALLLILSPLVLMLWTKVTDTFQADALENILETAGSTAKYLYGEGTADAAYNIGEIDPTNPLANLALVPAAINVTLFRPYVFEAKKVIIMFSAIESFALLILTIVVILKGRIFRFFKVAFSNNFLIFCLIFSLLFAIAVGASTFNFGSLVRYKIPLLPFFVTFLLVTYQELKPVKQTKLDAS